MDVVAPQKCFVKFKGLDVVETFIQVMGGSK